MKFTLRFSKSVVRDIENVLNATRVHFGEQQHERYKGLIREALSDIAADPRGAPARHRPEIHPDVWTFHLSRRGKRARHFFLYRVIGDGFIDVGRLLHDSMDLQQHMPEAYGSTNS